jgi:3-hydroxymyristoyl/3-hydroxydecanoyl-(acyl carrier protein) dehydratase
MSHDWFTIIKHLPSAADVIDTEIMVDPGAAWFDGHFPGAPMLPAVAQIALAVELVSKSVGKPVNISRLRRVRFKKAIQPGELLHFTISRRSFEGELKTGNPGEYEFRCSHEGQAVCSGFFSLRNG